MFKLIRKVRKKFLKQEISDSPEERIILTNDLIFPMKRSMRYLFMT